MRFALFGGLALFASGIAYAAGVASSVKQPEEICEEALGHLIKCDPAGFEVIKRHLRRTGDAHADAELEAIGAARDDDKWMAFFQSQMTMIKEHAKSYGEPIGFELVAARQVGGALKRLTYLCKYQKDWIRWQFTFYKPNGRWMLLGFKFDQNDEALFSDCGREETLSELRTARGPADEQR